MTIKASVGMQHILKSRDLQVEAFVFEQKLAPGGLYT